MTADAYRADPFAEHRAARHRATFTVLGAELRVTSNSPALLALARTAFAGLPPLRWSARPPRLRLSLRLVPTDGPVGRGAPPRPLFSANDGLLCAHIDRRSFVIVAPRARSAAVQVSAALLRHPYHVRYELLEFAALTLAARAQRLVSLHAACVGRGGRGALLLGESGAGKSTLTLACALDGGALLSEDCVFADARTVRVTGLPAFVHVAPGGTRLVDDPAMRARIRRSPRIRRRSGARKFELDARRAGLRLARKPLALATTVLLSPLAARQGRLLEPLDGASLAAALRRTQPYAVRQPGWQSFERALLRLGGYRMRRGANLEESVRALRGLLEARERA
jgi:hypothetical protein